MKSMGFSAPSGLDSSRVAWPAISEYPDNPLEGFRAQCLDLSCRLQQVELLVFSINLDSFAKLDEHIISILSKGCEERSDEGSADHPSLQRFPESCEVSDLSDNISLLKEDGLTTESIVRPGILSESPHTLLS